MVTRTRLNIVLYVLCLPCVLMYCCLLNAVHPDHILLTDNYSGIISSRNLVWLPVVRSVMHKIYP
jgi:hypothetical protein